MPKVFISYARDEARKVRQILSRLDKQGVDYWLDTRDLQSGQGWSEEITEAIKQCSKFLLFMSAESMASDNTKREVQIAYENQKKIIILRLDDSKIPNRFRYALAGLQWIDYSSQEWEKRILSAIGSYLEPSKAETKPVIAHPSWQPRREVSSPPDSSILTAVAIRHGLLARNPSTDNLEKRIYSSISKAPLSYQLEVYRETLVELERYLDAVDLWIPTSKSLGFIRADVLAIIDGLRHVRAIGYLGASSQLNSFRSLDGTIEALGSARDRLQTALEMFNSLGELNEDKSKRLFYQMRLIRTSIEAALNGSPDKAFLGTEESRAAYGASKLSLPIRTAAEFVRQQFGQDPNWMEINDAIWLYFSENPGKRLGLSAISQIAVYRELSVDDMLSVISLLTGPRQDFLRPIYYRQSEPSRELLLSVDEVVRQVRRRYYEKEIDESEWRRWGEEVLVGWEPTHKGS